MHPPTNMSVLSCLAFAACYDRERGIYATTGSCGRYHDFTQPVIAPSWTGTCRRHGGFGGKTEFATRCSTRHSIAEATYSGPLAGRSVPWQLGNVVLGAEVDGSWAFVRGNTNRNQTIITSSTNNGLGYRALATGAGRIGYAMGQWLAYAKGGVAWADMEITTRYQVLPTTYQRSLIGAVGGAGLEVAFLRNVSAKVEYNLIYIPTDHLVYASPNTTSSLDHLVQVVKAGINVRFGGDTDVLR
jgi:opacity protein-like surface antigen